jgi:microsomal dipeptidase-like Zn-dependent dipeptidase
MLELSQAPVIASHSSARALSDHSRNLSDELLMKVKENGGVVQAVALGTYVKKDKVEARNEKIKAINERVAAEMGVTLKERREVMAMAEADREAYMETYKSIQEKAKPIIEAEVDPVAPPVDVADFIDHIDYMVQLIGIDHVGISSDFDGGGGIKGWDDASETFNVTLEMVRRGYSEEEIGKIWSGNLLRVLDEVQAKAAELQQADAGK